MSSGHWFASSAGPWAHAWKCSPEVDRLSCVRVDLKVVGLVRGGVRHFEPIGQ